jgi:ADP-ribosyl-[dinitrogen reductase] hydrolase
MARERERRREGRTTTDTMLSFPLAGTTFPGRWWRARCTGCHPVSVDPDCLRDVRRRARAALLGLAVGDALGATVEFMLPAEIREAHGVHREITGGGWLRLAPGHVTDDTEMSLCIARAVAREGGWSLPAIADELGAWLRSQPTDVGNTCRRGIRRYLHDRSLEGPPSEGDAGNGAAMRMAPVALATLADGSLLERRAVEQAHLTHNHPLSDASCVLVGRLIQLACLGRDRSQLLRAAEAAGERFPALRYAAHPDLAPTAYVADTMRTVLRAFFDAPSFEECLVATVNRGGDADTTGAIAGAIAGAYFGPEAIPRRWVKKLDLAVVEELETLSGGLVDLSPLGRGESFTP